MKEVIRPTQLTNEDRSPYPGVRGQLMVDNSGEIARGVGAPKTPGAQKPQGEQERPTAKTGEGPRPVLSEADRLKQQYIDLSLRIAQAEGEEAIKAFEELPALLSSTAAELAKRGIDTGAFDKEVKEVLEEPRSIGPGTMPPGATDSALDQRLEQLFNTVQDARLRNFLVSKKGMPTGEQWLIKAVDDLQQIREDRSREYSHALAQLMEQLNATPDAGQKDRIRREIDEQESKFRNFENQQQEIRSGIHLFANEQLGAREGRDLYYGLSESEERVVREAQQAKARGGSLDTYKRELEPIISRMVGIAARGERIPALSTVRDLIIDDDMLAEFYLETIIRLPDDIPTDNFRLSFYTESEVEAFLQQVRATDEARGEGKDRYVHYATLRKVRQLFHEAYRAMLVGGGDLENFLRITPEITPREIQAHSEIIGVDMVERLVDRGLQRILHNKGKIIGNDYAEVQKWTEDQFRKLAKNVELYDASRGVYRKIEDWEIGRALTIGRNFMFINYRAPEYVSLSEVVEYPEQERWTSFPAEYSVRALQQLKWLAYRFKMGAAHVEFINIYREEFAKKLRSDGKPPELKKVGGVERGAYELSGALEASGLISSWRTQKAYLNTITIQLNPADHQELIEFMRRPEYRHVEELDFHITDDNRIGLGYYIDAIDAFINPVRVDDDIAKGYEYTKTKPDRKFYDSEKKARQAQYWDVIVRDAHFFLGDLVKRAPDAGDVKKRLWEKVAERVPVRTYYLLSDQMGNVGMTEAIESELIALEEERVVRGLNNLRVDKLSTQARNVYDEIVRIGRDNAKNLADIKFPYTPFMDDFRLTKGENYEGPKYEEWGSASMPRRYAGDLAGFYKGGGALIGIQDEPNRPIEEIEKSFHEALAGIASPQGKEAAQNVINPFIRTFARMAETYKRDKIPFLTYAYEISGAPTSKLQEHFGRKGQSLDEQKLGNFFENLTANGCLRRGLKRDERPTSIAENLFGLTPFIKKDRLSQVEQLRKDFGNRWFNMLWYYPRRLSDLSITAMIIEFLRNLFYSKV